MASTRTFQGVTYTNGNCPASLLAPLLGDNWGDETAYLRKDAAASWNRARAEAIASEGITLTVRGWNRTEATQVDFYLERHRRARAGDRVCCYWQDVPYAFTGTAHAAPPGTSNHGWAIAVDVVDFGGVGNFSHPRRVATIAILKRHGWTETEGRGSIQEPWHLVYDPALDQHKNDPTPTTEDDDMVTAQDRQDIAKAAADAVWGYVFQAAQSDGGRIPGESAGVRLLELRKDANRSEALDTETVLLARRIEKLTTENVLLSRGYDAVLNTLAAAVDVGVTGAELSRIVKDAAESAMENLTITLTNKEI